MPESLPDTDLLATRAAIEEWLTANGDALAPDLAANTLTLWARTFLELTEADSRAAEAHLRKRGATEFVERVLARAASDARRGVVTEPEAMARAFLAEVAGLSEDRNDHDRHGG